jgi:plasmid replication initiation protein
MSLQLETNKTQIQFTDLSLLNSGSLYKIRMNNILIENGNLFRYINTKILTKIREIIPNVFSMIEFNNGVL